MDMDWIPRVFGSVEAYRRALPSREWVKTDRGWTSRAR